MVDQARPDSPERDRRSIERRLVALERRPAPVWPTPVDVPFTPVWTNLTIGVAGSPANVGRFTALPGNELRLQVFARLGSDFAVTGEISVDMPPGWRLRPASDEANPGFGMWRASIPPRVFGFLQRRDDLGFLLVAVDGASSSATVPGTWIAGSTINLDVTIPVAPI